MIDEGLFEFYDEDLLLKENNVDDSLSFMSDIYETDDISSITSREYRIDYREFFSSFDFNLDDYNDFFNSIDDGEVYYKSSIKNFHNENEKIKKFLYLVKSKYISRFSVKDINEMEKNELSDFYLNDHNKGIVYNINKFLSFCFNVSGKYSLDDFIDSIKVFCFLSIGFNLKKKATTLKNRIYTIKNIILFLYPFFKKENDLFRRKRTSLTLKILNDFLKIAERKHNIERKTLISDDNFKLSLKSLRDIFFFSLKEMVIIILNYYRSNMFIGK